MNQLKRISGVLWILLSAGAIWFLFARAIAELNLSTVSPDKKIFWYSILPVYIPLMLGLALFGYFALKGEYDQVKKG